VEAACVPVAAAAAVDVLAVLVAVVRRDKADDLVAHDPVSVVEEKLVSRKNALAWLPVKQKMRKKTQRKNEFVY
jgi:hypothetical protein